ncbi:MAG: hypothetical protein ACYDCJ_12230 [Gammaproteobacteria bacterium]
MYKISKIVPPLCAALLLSVTGVQAQNAPAPSTAAPAPTATSNATHKVPATISPDATHKVPATQTSPTPAPSATTNNDSGG